MQPAVLLTALPHLVFSRYAVVSLR